MILMSSKIVLNDEIMNDKQETFQQYNNLSTVNDELTTIRIIKETWFGTCALNGSQPVS